MTCLGKMPPPNVGGSTISSCTIFCRPRTKVQFHLFHCSISHFARFQKNITSGGKSPNIKKKVQTHTHTHTSKMKKTMFLCFFLHVCCEVFFKKKKCTHPSIVSSFFVKVTFLQLERIQATGSTANMPL